MFKQFFPPPVLLSPARQRIYSAGMFRRLALLVAVLAGWNSAAGTVRVATYNVENYLDQPTESRHYVKSPEARAKVRESLRALQPDVVALEEIGSTAALLELRAALQAEGLNFPYWDHVTGFDTNIHVAILSKFPIVASRPHTNDFFLLDGRRFRVSRGFAEVEIQTDDHFTFTVLAAHLKSRRPTPVADEAEERLQEATVLRQIVDQHLQANPEARLIVLGDFNDVKNSAPLREIIGRGKLKLTDTRPAERNGDAPSAFPARYEARNVTWTHYYAVEDTYSRIDYILCSPAMARNWQKDGTFIATVPNWGLGSDHRPMVASFNTGKN